MTNDAIDDLVDWQLRNPPKDTTWSCPECGMKWTERPDRCPCDEPEHETPPSGRSGPAVSPS